MTHFKANPDFMEKLLNSPQIAKALLPRGRAVLQEAESTAPVDTGAYKNALEVWVDVTDRVGVRVGVRDSSVWYAAMLNARTGHLARALDAQQGE